MKMLNRKKKQAGFASLIMVLFLVFLGLALFATLSSRLLLSIQRSQSASDQMVSLYRAESDIYDIIAKILGNYSIPLPQTTERTLSDGTKLLVVGKLEAAGPHFTVTAERPYANTTIELSRTTTESVSETFEKTDIVFMLDCSGSMSGGVGGGNTRMDVMRNGMKRALEKIMAVPNYADFFRVGVLTFQTNTSWMAAYKNDPQNHGSELLSDRFLLENNHNIATIYEAIDKRIQSNRDKLADENHNGDIDKNDKNVDKNVCHDTDNNADYHEGYTNLGQALITAYTNLELTSSPDRRKIAVLVTDGRPTAASANPACVPPVTACEDCQTAGDKYLECALKPPALGGQTNEEAETYVLMVDTARSKTDDILTSYVGDNYFSVNSDKFVDTLETIIERVIEKSNTLYIRRVIPQPSPLMP